MTMTPKQYLQQYKYISDYISSLNEERAQLYNAATKVTPAITGGSSGNGSISDKVGKTVAKIVDLDRRIASETEKLADVQADIYSQVSEIDDIRMRQVLTLAYLLRKPKDKRTENDYSGNYSFSEIGEILGYSEIQVKRIHGNALCRIKPKNIINNDTE